VYDVQEAAAAAARAAAVATSAIAAVAAARAAMAARDSEFEVGLHVVVSTTVYKSAADIGAASGAQSMHEGMRGRLEGSGPGTVVRVGEGGTECDIELDDGERKEGVALHEVSVPTLERDNHRNGVITKQAEDSSFHVKFDDGEEPREGNLTGERTAEVKVGPLFLCQHSQEQLKQDDLSVPLVISLFDCLPFFTHRLDCAEDWGAGEDEERCSCGRGRDGS
jgi:hypothetical protein